MSEILSGARYTLGGLIVMTVWSIGAVQFVEWKLSVDAKALAAEQYEREYNELMGIAESK